MMVTSSHSSDVNLLISAFAALSRGEAVEKGWIRIASTICRDQRGRYLVYWRPDDATRFPGHYEVSFGSGINVGESYLSRDSLAWPRLAPRHLCRPAAIAASPTGSGSGTGGPGAHWQGEHVLDRAIVPPPWTKAEAEKRPAQGRVHSDRGLVVAMITARPPEVAQAILRGGL
jgi:hypothetical protein